MKIKVGAIVCIWCGETVWHATASGRAKALDTMQSHDRSCPKHPAMIALAAARSEIERTNALLDAAKEVREADKAEIKRHKKAYGELLIDRESLYAISEERGAEIERLNDEIKKMLAVTWCSYCGLTITIDDEAASKISAHIQECPKHPIAGYKAEIARLKSTDDEHRNLMLQQQQEMADEIERLHKQRVDLIEALGVYQRGGGVAIRASGDIPVTKATYGDDESKTGEV